LRFGAPRRAQVLESFVDRAALGGIREGDLANVPWIRQVRPALRRLGDFQSSEYVAVVDDSKGRNDIANPKAFGIDERFAAEHRGDPAFTVAKDSRVIRGKTAGR